MARFARNIFIFMVAEVFVLILALIIAVMRSLRGPVFTPLRILAAAYTDLFRARPDDPGDPAARVRGAGAADQGRAALGLFWAIVALVLVYSAYVAEVYRAGIQSVHPSQVASARALGLSRGKTMRFVVIPQAVRRVIPPLLNDFIGLQKDSALVAVARVHRGAPRGADHLGRELRLHAVRGARPHLHRDHDPRGALRRTGSSRGTSAGARPWEGCEVARAAALRIEDLHKSFDGLEVLKGIDLEVDEHEVVGLIGASGSGKSTLLRCINLLEP